MEDIKTKMYDYLVDVLGVSEETVNVVTDINGWTEETFKDILYATNGYHDFDQLEDDFYEE